MKLFFPVLVLETRKKYFSIVIELTIVNEQSEYCISQLLPGGKNLRKKEQYKFCCTESRKKPKPTKNKEKQS